MSARSKARKRALDVLYSADVRGQRFEVALAEAAERAAAEPERSASWQYARDIVDGVIEHRDEIDALIEAHANGWSLNRMPAVDRAILRMATWEMSYNPNIDFAVAINEAITLAQELSTDDSSRFINGVLGSIVGDPALGGVDS